MLLVCRNVYIYIYLCIYIRQIMKWEQERQQETGTRNEHKHIAVGNIHSVCVCVWLCELSENNIHTREWRIHRNRRAYTIFKCITKRIYFGKSNKNQILATIFMQFYANNSWFNSYCQYWMIMNQYWTTLIQSIDCNNAKISTTVLFLFYLTDLFAIGCACVGWLQTGRNEINNHNKNTIASGAATATTTTTLWQQQQ